MGDKKNITTKIVGAIIGAKLLGPVGIWLGSKAGDEYGDKLGDFLKDKGPEVIEQLTTRIEAYSALPEENFNYDLARAIVKVWQTSLADLQHSFPGDKLLDGETVADKKAKKELVNCWIEQLKKAQDDTGLLLDLFRDCANDFLNQRTTGDVLEIISDQRQSEEAYWESLENGLVKWARVQEKYPDGWGSKLPEPFRAKVKQALLRDISAKIEPIFKENDAAWRAFEYAHAQLEQAFMARTDRKLDDIWNILERAFPHLTPAPADPEALRRDVLTYLERLAREAAKLPVYYPNHLCETNDGHTLFDDIRQIVQVVTDRKQFDDWSVQERQRAAGEFMAYDPRRARPETHGFDEVERPEPPSPPVPWDAAAGQRFRRAVILGDPGFGKSWLLRFEARRLARAELERLRAGGALAEAKLPILLRLSDLARYAKRHDRVTDALAGHAAGEGSERPLSDHFRAWIKARIEAGQCYILLDALDEVAEKPENPQETLSRGELRQKLRGFSDANKDQRILLTSRIVGYLDSPIEDAEELELIAFEKEQVDSFINVWFAGDQTTAGRFRRTLRDRPQVAGLARIPLMLSLLCRLSGEISGGEEFPERRVVIYDRCLRGLLKGWREERHEAEVDDVDAILEALAAVAYELFVQQAEQFKQSHFRQILQKWLRRQQPGDSLYGVTAERLIARLKSDGILIQATTDSDPQLLFLHRTFQEYLAASELGTRDDYLTIALPQVYQPEWAEVLRLLGGLLGARAVEYIDALVAKNREDIFYRPFQLAVFAAIEAGANLREAHRRALFDQSMALYFNPPFKLESKYFLSTVKCWTSSAVDYMLAILPNEPIDSYLCRKVASALGEMKAERAVDAMLAILNYERIHNYSGRGVAEALGKMKAERAVDGMLAILRDEQVNLVLRGAVARALGAMKADGAVDGMLAILRDEQIDKYVRLEVARALGKIKVERTVDYMLAILKDEQSDKYLLGNVARELGEMKVERAVDGMLAIFKDEQSDSYVRIKVAWALGEMKVEGAVDDMLAILRDEQIDKYVRLEVARALGKIKAERAVDDMLAILKDEQSDKYLLGNVARELGEMKVERAVDGMLAVLNDEQSDSHVRIMVAWALCAMKAERAVDDMLAILKDEQSDSDVPGVVAIVLGKMKVERAVDGMLAIIRNEQIDKYVRCEVARRLGEMKLERVADDMFAVLTDEQRDSDVRGAVARALGKMKVERAVDGMRAILRNEQIDKYVRIGVASALGDFGVHALVELRAIAFNENAEDYWVKDACWRSLRKIAFAHRKPIAPPDDPGSAGILPA